MNFKLFRLIHDEKTYKRYYYQPLNERLSTPIIWRAGFEAKNFVIDLARAIYFPFNPKYNKQQYNGIRKAKIQMVYENVAWFLKYKEICFYYFLYGLDVKGREPNDYLAYTEFRVLRNIINIRQRETMKTGYSFNYLALVHDKFLFYQYCKSLGMPFPDTIALVSKGKVSWYDGKKMNWSPFDSLLDRNFTAFCKEVTGEGGKGAFVLEIENGIVRITGNEATLEELKEKFGNSTFILQEKITNHRILKEIYPDSLNTLRLHTILNTDGNVEFFSAVQRFGANGSIVDNGCHGGMFVGVNEYGILKDYGCHEPQMKYEKLIIRENHPNTGVKFSGMKLPYWDEILETAKTFHQFMYGIPSMGWDIAITEDGFCFTEAGDDWEIAFDQSVNGPQRTHFYETHGYALDIPLRKL